MHPIKTINMPTNMSIRVTQTNNWITCGMHIPLTFQLVIKGLILLQTSFTLWSIPTNQPQHILLKNINSLHSVTYPSYFYHLFRHLPLHHDPNTTNSISSSRPPQIICSTFHPQHHCSLLPPSHLLLSTHINHPLSQFFSNFSPLSTQTT